jgi:hypothetical protein
LTFQALTSLFFFFQQDKLNRRLEDQNGDSDHRRGGGGGHRSKRIHVRSKDPLKIARQIEKNLNAEPKRHKGGQGGQKGVRRSLTKREISTILVRESPVSD